MPDRRCSWQAPLQDKESRSVSFSTTLVSALRVVEQGLLLQIDDGGS
jgi:hypothetical protein